MLLELLKAGGHVDRLDITLAFGIGRRVPEDRVRLLL